MLVSAGVINGIEGKEDRIHCLSTKETTKKFATYWGRPIQVWAIFITLLCVVRDEKKRNLKADRNSK